MSRSEIKEFYAKGGETDRLNHPNFLLEGIRTKQIVERYIDRPKLEILDVGGGAGFYSFWLQKMGHQVTLIDLSEENISAANDYEITSGIKLKELRTGNALKLSLEDNSFDLVLLMGPLYHLLEKPERIQAIAEAKRVLKPGGIVIAAIISRYASLMDGFSRDFVYDDAFFDVVRTDLATGMHHNPTNNPQYFTTSYFHHPAELETEINEGGLQFKKLIAVESFGWILKDLDKKQGDGPYMNKLLSTIQSLESNQDLIAISPHIIGIGTKL